MGQQMNVENILRVADAIEQHSIPDLGFNMGVWMDRYAVPGDDKSGHNCGTCACIGGWTQELFGLEPYDDHAAGAVLGLDREAGNQLFYPVSAIVPQPFDATPARAAAVLRHLAATGEVDWSVTSPEAA